MSALSVIESILVHKAASVQSTYCSMHGLLLLAPKNGRCRSCGQQIYDSPAMQYKAGNTHITGCPHCDRTYCD